MLTIFRRRPIEIDCYVSDSEGEPVVVPADKVEATLVGPVHKLKLTDITLITEGGREDKPYYRIATQGQLLMYEPGVYSMRLKIENKKNRLNEMFSLTTYPGDDNTGLPAGETVRLNVFVKESTNTWSGEIVLNSSIDGIQVNGQMYRPQWGVITLPDYPTVPSVVVDSENIIQPSNGVYDLSPVITDGFETYIPNKHYDRGECFKFLGSNGYWTAFRVEHDGGMTAGETPDWGCCERITAKRLAYPLNIGTNHIYNELI